MYNQTIFDSECMDAAIAEAKIAHRRGDYAIGAVMAKDGVVVARGGNRVRTKNDSTKHIELEIIQYVVGASHGRYLKGHTLYTTHAPCPMCLTAACWAGISRIVFGMSQEDMKRFALEYATPEFRWRGTDLEPGTLYGNHLIAINPGMAIDQIKRDEVFVEISKLMQEGHG